MKLQYGILGMVLVSGGAFAHDMNAEGIQVGGYVDARYTWMKGEKPAGKNSFTLGEGALYAGKRVGGASVFMDLAFTATYGLTVQQAYVANTLDSGLMWKAGRFDGIFGWVANDSGHYQLTTRGLVQGMLETDHGGLLLGYNFSDMLSAHFLVAQNQAVSERAAAGGVEGNMDKPSFGFKLDSKMDAFDLGLGYYMEKNATNAEKTDWSLDVVAGTKFADYDFKAIYVMHKDAAADFNKMGFGAHVGGSVTEMVGFGARVEWQKQAEKQTELQVTVGPQFNLEKGFVVKADYTFGKKGGDNYTDAQKEAAHTLAVAAVYDF